MTSQNNKPENEIDPNNRAHGLDYDDNAGAITVETGSEEQVEKHGRQLRILIYILFLNDLTITISYSANIMSNKDADFSAYQIARN